MKSKKILSGVLAGLVVTFCLISSGCLEEEKFEKKTGELEILSSSGQLVYDEYLNWTKVNVTGKAKNVGDKVLSYASVEAKFYDSSGNLLGHSLDNINDLAPNEIWNFEITYYDDTNTVGNYSVYVGSCW